MRRAIAPLTHFHPGRRTIAADRARGVGLIVGRTGFQRRELRRSGGVWGRIDVSSRAGTPAGTVLIEIADDGVGLPEFFDPKDRRRGGAESVRSLADQMAATFTSATMASGCRCVLTFRAAGRTPKALKMRTFQIYVEDTRYTVPTLHVATLTGEARRLPRSPSGCWRSSSTTRRGSRRRWPTPVRSGLPGSRIPWCLPLDGLAAASGE